MNTNWKSRPEKAFCREQAVSCSEYIDDGMKIFLPSDTLLCVENAIKTGLVKNTDHLLFIENGSNKNYDYIHSCQLDFCKKHNLINVDFFHGDLDDCDLKKYLKEDEKICYAFYDICGILTKKMADWFVEAEKLYTDHAIICHTFYNTDRKSSPFLSKTLDILEYDREISEIVNTLKKEYFCSDTELVQYMTVHFILNYSKRIYSAKYCDKNPMHFSMFYVEKNINPRICNEVRERFLNLIHSETNSIFSEEEIKIGLKNLTKARRNFTNYFIDYSEVNKSYLDEVKKFLIYFFEHCRIKCNDLSQEDTKIMIEKIYKNKIHDLKCNREKLSVFFEEEKNDCIEYVLKRNQNRQIIENKNVSTEPDEELIRWVYEKDNDIKKPRKNYLIKNENGRFSVIINYNDIKKSFSKILRNKNDEFIYNRELAKEMVDKINEKVTNYSYEEKVLDNKDSDISVIDQLKSFLKEIEDYEMKIIETKWKIKNFIFDNKVKNVKNVDELLNIVDFIQK